MGKRKKQYKKVASNDNCIAEENLPMSIVLYPGFYGTFFGFCESDNSDIYFCSCAKEAICNYLKFRLSQPIPMNSYPTRCFVLDSMDFPISLVEQLMAKGVKNDFNVLNHLKFENKLCHECNLAVPSYSYCVPMYGSVFKQTYGWYINKQSYEYAVHPLSFGILYESCPQEILDLVETDPNEFIALYQSIQIMDFKARSEVSEKLGKQNNKILKVIENEVRLKFGHKKIGEAWTSETILFYIVQSLYPDLSILRHFRPDFLDGLELDVYIKELQIALEYQGIQHYKTIKHWGGEEGLTKLKERDNRKRKICHSKGINIIYFRYDEDLNDQIVKDRIAEFS